MNTPRQRQAGRISRTQLIAMALIVLLGLVAGGLLLKGDNKTQAMSDEAREKQERDEAKGKHEKDEKEADGQKDEKERKEDKGHGDAEQREKAPAREGEQAPVVLTADQIKAAGIVVAQASAGRIGTTILMPGEIRFNEDRTARVVPRFGGVVESVAANLGQSVKKGQLLATVSSPALSDLRSELQSAQKRLGLAKTTYEREKKLFEDKISPEMDYLQAQQALREAEIATANAAQKLKALGASPTSDNLSRYELRAPFDAMVVEKHLALGEAVKEDTPVFTISDLSGVWAEISVPAKDLPLVRVGEKVSVHASSFEQTTTGTISYVGALIGEQTRTATARIVLANPKMAWRPGLLVNVEIIAGEVETPVTVASSAIQTVEGREVVFMAVSEGFKAQPVKTGRTDGQHTEILSGLKVGDRYASTNSFVIKAEGGKASAEHDE
ncbi:efflux RND transporter periplasmic adaptor subunit [Aquabacterium sp.]|uniref:efflux RND transporter periplasmic adaptor subunit n=1 Tax=Aquabacterium sp. TaxID=1872578 RepID=UPI0035B05326